MLKTNTFSGGSNSTTITTGNSGGASGDAFTSVFGSPTYTSTDATGGRAPLVCNFPADDGAVEWDISIAARTLYARTYLRLGSNPASDSLLFYAFNSGFTVLAGTLRISTAGKLRFVNDADTQLAITSASITLSQWVRIELKIVTGTTTGNGALEIRLYNTDADASTATETVPVSSVNTGTTLPAHAGWQGLEGVASKIDDVALTDVDWLGPAMSSTLPTPMLVGQQQAIRRSRFY